MKPSRVSGRFAVALAPWLAAACAARVPARVSAGSDATSAPMSASPREATGVVSTASAGASTSTGAAPAADDGIAWIHDEPEAAFARAKREHKLVVVDLWAAWCHTCLSMQRYVLNDAHLPRAGARFVFLAIDTELAKNAAFLQRFPPSGWPTFYVLSPEAESVRARWLGAASPSQFARFLADATESKERAQGTRAGGADPWSLLAQADALAAQTRYVEAAAKYAEVLASAPADWPRGADVRVARASALKRGGQASACVDMAFEPAFSALRPAISAADQASYVLGCTEQLPAADPRRKDARKLVEARLTALCENGDSELTPDDRGDACGNLMEVREALGDGAGAKKAAGVRLAVLEAASRGLPDDAALTYDLARGDTLVALGRGEEALASLQARQAALPDNYNAAHYVARVALKLRKYELGLGAIERALALAQGPRRSNLFGVKVELLLGAGREREAVAVMHEQLAALEALPDGQKRPEAERSVRERLAKQTPVK